MFFKPKHNLPYQFFFHRDTVYHDVTGSIIVNSSKYKLDETEVNFSIVGLRSEAVDITPDLVRAIFIEARKAGLKPLAITAIQGRRYPVTTTRLTLKRIAAPSSGVVVEPFATVKAMRYQSKEVFDVHLEDEHYQAPVKVPLTPENIQVLFDTIVDRGFIPISLEGLEPFRPHGDIQDPDTQPGDTAQCRLSMKELAQSMIDRVSAPNGDGNVMPGIKHPKDFEGDGPTFFDGLDAPSVIRRRQTPELNPKPTDA